MHFLPEKFSLLEEKNVPVLGLMWKLKNDTFTIYLLDAFEDNIPVTKRKILSAVNRIFNPLGFTCPATLVPNIHFQRMLEIESFLGC